LITNIFRPDYFSAISEFPVNESGINGKQPFENRKSQNDYTTKYCAASMVELEEIASFLNVRLGVDQFADDQNGIYRASERYISRLGLALEPYPGLPQWIAAERLDALMIHRPWRLPEDQIPDSIGILAYHLAFDEHLTIGYNPRLAEVLDISSLEKFGDKHGRPLGMAGHISPCTFAVFHALVYQVFGGLENTFADFSREIKRVAVVGAMNRSLIMQAAERDIDVYITGQFRKEAAPAVIDTGINVIVVGHQRSEKWGLRTMANILRERWAGLEVVISE
jgi:putative NIF3 family GTP cyclohydrolase 1 type 2